MQKFYQMEAEDVKNIYHTGAGGLTASQVTQIRQEKGENILAERKKKSFFRVFLESFCDLMVIILIVAAVISILSGNTESTVVILVVIVINSVLGTVQYAKAQKSLDSLKALSSPRAKLLRDGAKVQVPSREVVPGDILLLEAGDMVVADGRILENYALQVNESSLTGESLNVDKTDQVIKEDVVLADRINMVYSGSLVASGRAVVVVTGTGMDTEIGRIAELMNQTGEKKTPLQVSLDNFSKKLAILIMIICAVVFVMGIYRGMQLLDAMVFAVALAVAAIPEALASIVTIVQAMGTQKMAKENAIMKELKAVESLGCVSVICSDKTGTLTQNKMTVQEVYINGHTLPGKELSMECPLEQRLLLDMILDNDSTVSNDKGIGDPTEFCMLQMAEQAGIPWREIREQHPRLEEIAFDSDRKLMSTRFLVCEEVLTGKDNDIDTEDIIFTKGALDVLIDRSIRVAAADADGNIIEKPMDAEEKEKILKQNLLFSQNGLRVLAFAYRRISKNRALTLEEEKEYTFLGLVSMIDPPREESEAAVADAKRAGIKPVMITGDHQITATAIAKQIGIFDEGDLAMTGAQLDGMPDTELDEKLERISVYARVSPENKIRIVEAWQRKGRIVAMTGDGVNDAPALKKADIGVAMGITGTEVSKDAASMILADDNFATIIKAVANGRNVYRNIINAVQFLLSGNTAGIFAVLYTSLMALPVPFEPVHLLFINLVTDSLPALAIGMEPPEADILSQPPRNPKGGILNRTFVGKLLGFGGLIAASTLIAFYYGLQTSAALASTMAFSVLTLARLFHGFNCRSTHSVFKIGMKRNWWSLGAFVLGVLLVHLVLLIPVLKRLFLVADLDGMHFLLIYILAFLPTLVIQLIKVIREHRG